MVETTMLILRPGRAAETREAHDLPQFPGLTLLRGLLCVEGLLGVGTNLEHVSVMRDDFRPTDMFVDEDGVSKRLAPNPAATKIYRAFWLSRHPETKKEDLPQIYGTAVVMSRRVWS